MRFSIICAVVILSACSIAIGQDKLFGNDNLLEIQRNPLDQVRPINPMLASSAVKANKDPGVDILKSFILPGWGQISQGRNKTAYAFLSVELSLWASFFGLRTYAAWLEDDYKSFAKQHAGIRNGQDHQFYIDIGNWMNRDGYNEARLRERSFDRLYTTEETQWNWDSDENRRSFKSMRLSSDAARQNSIIFMGGIIFNHLASAIEAGRKGHKMQTQTSFAPMGTDGWKVDVAISL